MQDCLKVVNKARDDCKNGITKSKSECEAVLERLKPSVPDIPDGPSAPDVGDVVGRRRRRQTKYGQELNIEAQLNLLRLLNRQDESTKRAYRLIEG